MIADGTLLGCGHEANGEVGYSVLGSLGGKTMCRPCNEQRKRADYSPRVLRRERRPLKVGMSTLVGVMGFAEVSGPCPKCGHDHVAEPKCTRWGDGVTAVCTVNECGGKLPVKDPFPLRSGNCCDILNMNSENVEEALKRWPGLNEDCEVEIIELKERGRERVRVVDSRVPASWRRHVCSGCGVYEWGDE